MVEEKSIGQIYSECCDWMLLLTKNCIYWNTFFPFNIKPGFDIINS